MIVPSTQKIKSTATVPHKVYQVPFTADFLDSLIRFEMEGRKLQSLKKLPATLSGLCEGALNSTELLKELQGFDLIVYDSVAFCGPLVGELLGIPRVEIFPAAPNLALGFYHMIPMPVSYVPQLIRGYTDKMTFMERVINLAAYFGANVVMSLLYDRPMDALKVKFNIKPERSFQEAVIDAELVIITADFALEYPQPLLPGMDYDVTKL